MNLEELKLTVSHSRGKYIHIESSNNTMWTDPDLRESVYNSFDKCLEGGRDYLCGKLLDMELFKKKYRSAITNWMKHIVIYSYHHPDEKLVFTIDKGNFGSLTYHIYRRGEYVEIALPYHDEGGEKNWITRNLKTKYLVNVD